jgi:hypothetical protein
MVSPIRGPQSFDDFNCRTGIETFVHLFDSLSKFTDRHSPSEKSTLTKLGLEFCNKLSGGQTAEFLDWMFTRNRAGKNLVKSLDCLESRFKFMPFMMFFLFNR